MERERESKGGSGTDGQTDGQTEAAAREILLLVPEDIPNRQCLQSNSRWRGRQAAPC